MWYDSSLTVWYDLLCPFPTPRGQNVCQNDSVRVHADVKS